jgi:hypothetical protein
LRARKVSPGPGDHQLVSTPSDKIKVSGKLQSEACVSWSLLRLNFVYEVCVCIKSVFPPIHAITVRVKLAGKGPQVFCSLVDLLQSRTKDNTNGSLQSSQVSRLPERDQLY